MTCMNQNAFGGEIMELSFAEIDAVDGASLSLGTKAALRLVGRVALGAGAAGIAVGIGIELYIALSD